MLTLLSEVMSRPLKIRTRGYSGRRGLYSRLDIDRTDKGYKEVYSTFFRNTPPCGIDEFSTNPHLTVVHSTGRAVPYSSMSWISDILNISQPCSAYLVGVSYWPGTAQGGKKGYLILNMRGSTLTDLHAFMLDLGATHSYGTYVPHITLAKDIGPLTPDLREWIAQTNILFSTREAQRVTFNSLTLEDLAY